MRIDWNIVAKFSAVILFLLTTIVGVVKFGFGTVQANSEMKAELKFKDKYDSILTDYITLKITCDTSH